MYELCIKSIMEKDIQTLKQILLKFSCIRQLYFHLQESHFASLLAAINYHSLTQQSSLVIEPFTLYLFFDKGNVLNKQKEIKMENLGKKTVLRSGKRMLGNQKQINKKLKHNKQSNRYQISEYESYFDYNTSNIRLDQIIYIAKQSKQSLVLMLQMNKLTDIINQKIQQINYQKLKCIYNYPIFQNIQRDLIKQEINRFHFKKYKFNQYLYNQGSVEQRTFFIKIGTIEISNKINNKTYVMDGKFMIGYNKQNKQRARSISEMIVCYSISNKTLFSILKKREFKTNEILTKNFQMPNPSGFLTPLFYEDFNNQNQNNSLFNRKQESKQNFHSITRTNSQIFKKNIHHRTESLQEIQSKLSRRLKLRCHFSNFYNQVFNAYSEKKMKQMGLNMNDQQNLRLYEIKLLKKTMPVMDEIKQKLRKTKEYKMKLCKIRLQEMQNKRSYGQSCMQIVQL